ncbi:MAG: NRDE family protein [Halobacteriales archaeon]|nr:NRDE family protein [Halobacteriales archaeon]
MCTIIVAWQVFEEIPFVAAANRTEAYDRPAVGPRVLHDDPRIVGPQDRTAGGTWIGHNEFGLIGAVTNRWTDATLAGTRSRGLLTRDALTYESVAEARPFVDAQVEEYEFAGFNLLLADRDDALLFEWDGDLTVTPLSPGVSIVVNVGSTVGNGFTIPTTRSAEGEAQAANTRRALEAVRPDEGESAHEWLDRTTDVLRDHVYGFCIHSYIFGTRSSSTYLLYEDGTVDTRFADGPPCQTDYAPVSINRTE